MASLKDSIIDNASIFLGDIQGQAGHEWYDDMDYTNFTETEMYEIYCEAISKVIPPNFQYTVGEIATYWQKVKGI